MYEPECAGAFMGGLLFAVQWIDFWPAVGAGILCAVVTSMVAKGR